ncbi:hypothetical protein E6C50_02755 [Flavobacterium supellecticarium]|uniref:DUF6922 domain-containing protein n=1 Tax=Flavobacterium supellecticarium TaxID=2565924 RepID=A0A4S4A3X6_9FLAO|nr:hypothetical protein [Flavobacterium supellecticarium]THF53142.1 hypothetical protein E6C50_02755 [Flavobacterium supellecticarium]
MKIKNINKDVPNLDPKFFWEYDFDKMDWDEAYKMVIGRIIERGSQQEADELVRFYGYERVIKALRDEIYFLPNYGIDSAIEFFPELKKEEMYCYLNRLGKPYDWL